MNSSPKSSKELPSQTFKYKEHSKRNLPNYLLRSQSSLESSSKASRNSKKPQISEALRIQASKALKNFHHKLSKTNNAQRTRRHKEFLTSSKLEIRCNSISRVFDPSFSQIEVYLVFKSKSHYHNSNQQIFQGDQIRRSLFCNFIELYHILINTNSHL